MGATTLTLLGGAGTVTGSKYLVEIDRPDGPRRILIDAGMFQGVKKLRLLNWADFPVPPASITDILLTHAHMDHTGYLPRLVKNGFRGSIWGTDATLALTEIVLRDSAYLQERDAEFANAHGFSRHATPQPLYRIGDVERTLPLFRTIEFDRPLDLGDGLEAVWTRAGHILGSGSIRLETPDGSVLFSGDLGAPHTPLLPAPKSPYAADIVVLESTYGDRLHEDRRARRDRLRAIVEHAFDNGGTLLIPAFSIGRTQELLYELEAIIHQHRQRRLTQGRTWDDLDIILDSPLAADFTAGYARLRDHWDREAKRRLDSGRHPLDFEQLITIDDHATHLRTVDYLTRSARPAIVIAASGMCAGGRIVNYLKAMLGDPRHDVLFVGYQAAGTPGWAIQRYGPRGGYVDLDGTRLDIRAGIHTLGGYSAHADQKDLINFVTRLRVKPKKIILVHGDTDAKHALQHALLERLPQTDVVIG